MFNTVEQSGEYYDAQKASISALKLHEWYNFIVQYRELQAETAMSWLSNVNTPKEQIPYLQAKYNLAIEFLWFLDGN